MVLSAAGRESAGGTCWGSHAGASAEGATSCGREGGGGAGGAEGGWRGVWRGGGVESTSVGRGGGWTSESWRFNFKVDLLFVLGGVLFCGDRVDGRRVRRSSKLSRVGRWCG